MKNTQHLLETLSSGYQYHAFPHSCIVHADCFQWLAGLPENTLHAIVTDPPYGVKEYEVDQLEKRALGSGGIWRIPPSFDGCERAPLPRFTALNLKERETLHRFFTDWAQIALRVMRPGGHIFIASNAILSQLVFSALSDAGLEFRGQVTRLVRTLRGGDRPKNAHEEFPNVCVLPKGCYEPWGLFRKPLPAGMRVSDCLRQFGTGGLRRLADGSPFEDIIESGRTPREEKAIAPHPSLKPQSFMRLIVYTALPLGTGLIADPFMGGGSTIAAAEAVGVPAIGIERSREFFNIARSGIGKLSALQLPGTDELVGKGQAPLFDHRMPTHKTHARGAAHSVR